MEWGGAYQRLGGGAQDPCTSPAFMHQCNRFSYCYFVI